MSKYYKDMQPVVWIAAVAIIAVSGVGIAKMTGLIGEKPADEQIASATDTDAAKNAVPVPATRVAPRNLGNTQGEPSPSPNTYPARHRYCNDCGVVEAVRKVEVPVKPSGVGAVAGGVL